MAIKALISTVTGVVNNVIYRLEGVDIGLAFNGNDKRHARTLVDVDGALGIDLEVRAPKGTKFELTIACDEKPDEPFFTFEGMTNRDGIGVCLTSRECPCTDV